MTRAGKCSVDPPKTFYVDSMQYAYPVERSTLLLALLDARNDVVYAEDHARRLVIVHARTHGNANREISITLETKYGNGLATRRRPRRSHDGPQLRARRE